MTLHSRSSHGHELDNIDTGDDHHHQPHQVVNLSRLSVCRYQYDPEHEQDGIDEAGNISMFMSQLSIDGFECDADDEKKLERGQGEAGLSSSSDSDGYYSLPATPPRIRRKSQVKVYASENEAKKSSLKRRKRRTGGHDMSKKDKDKKRGMSVEESESSGVMLVERPKGKEGRKACRDLGSELEMPMAMPSRVRVSISAGSGSAVDSSSASASGGNSPISHWRISSPGDDPRDVKARLKIWAQAVALASTARPTD